MKKLSKISYALPALLVLLPFITFAQDGLFGTLGTVRQFIAALVPIAIGLAVLYFLFGVLKYVVAKDSDSQKEARTIMVSGVVILFVMVSLWGLVNLLQETFDIGQTNPINPTLIP